MFCPCGIELDTCICELAHPTTKNPQRIIDKNNFILISYTD